MKLERRKSPLLIVPTTSMGDIAFLLIIFFILTSNFIKEAHVELTPASSPDIEILESTAVSVAVDKDGLIYVQGEACSPELLQNLTESLLEGQQEKVVMLKVDKDLPEEMFRPALMALSRAGAEIALVGTKTEE